MQSVLFATKNPAKIKYMQDIVQPLDIILNGIRDFEVSEIQELGNTPLENARSKALAYYQVFQQPLFSCDSGLYFKGLPEECQPGVHVRRRQGKRLNDEEMTAWYAHLANTYGTITAYYVNAICYIKDAEHIYESDDVSLWSQPFHIVSTPHEKKVSGFPLDRISKNVQTGLYFYDQEQELNELEAIGIRSFFKKHIIL